MAQTVRVILEYTTGTDRPITEEDATRIADKIVGMGANNACHLDDDTKAMLALYRIKCISVISAGPVPAPTEGATDG